MNEFGLDHVMIGWRDLSGLMSWFELETGIAPTSGGSHAGLGTRNALVSLGSDCYLELLALDPAQEASTPIARSLAKLERPTSIGWAYHCDDAGQAAETLRSAGLRVNERSMQRRTPGDKLLSWALVFVDHSFGPVVPFLIDWRDSPSPAGSSIGGARLREATPMHPEPSGAQAIFNAMRIPLTVLEGPRSGPLLEFATPKGDLRVAP